MKYEFFDSPVHGIGCCATVDIKAYEIVSKEPYFVVKKSVKNNRIKDFFKKYIWGGNLIHDPHSYLMINGIGLWCNGSLIDPNVVAKPMSTENKIQFMAVKDIKKGEEFFLHYDPKTES
jgi:SET domain-containing protein